MVRDFRVQKRVDDAGISHNSGLESKDRPLNSELNVELFPDYSRSQVFAKNWE